MALARLSPTPVAAVADVEWIVPPYSRGHRLAYTSAIDLGRGEVLLVTCNSVLPYFQEILECVSRLRSAHLHAPLVLALDHTSRHMAIVVRACAASGVDAIVGLESVKHLTRSELVEQLSSDLMFDLVAPNWLAAAGLTLGFADCKVPLFQQLTARPYGAHRLSPKKWQRIRRAIAATLALQRNTSWTVARGAIEAGFSEHSSYTRALRTATGITPKEARQWVGWTPIAWHWLKAPRY